MLKYKEDTKLHSEWMEMCFDTNGDGWVGVGGAEAHQRHSPSSNVRWCSLDGLLAEKFRKSLALKSARVTVNNFCSQDSVPGGNSTE